jgi:hypothetical protein
MPMITPKKAVCSYDLAPGVLCCSSCGKCGRHAHGGCAVGVGLSDPVVATCSVSMCMHGGVLCCSVEGACGQHAHPHGQPIAAARRARTSSRRSSRKGSRKAAAPARRRSSRKARKRR